MPSRGLPGKEVAEENQLGLGMTGKDDSSVCPVELYDDTHLVSLYDDTQYLMGAPSVFVKWRFLCWVPAVHAY